MQTENVSTYRRSRSSLRRALVFFLTITLVLVPLSYVLTWTGHASTNNVVEPIFTTMLGGGNAGIVLHSSPILADVDGNSSNGLEIVVGTLQNQSGEQGGYPAYLSVLKSNGDPLWEVSVAGSINSSPAVGNINGDDEMEIVVGLGAENEPQTPGGLAAYSASGAPLWQITTLDRIGGGAGHNLPNELADGVFASPSIANVDDDAENEVIFGAWDQRIHLVNGNDGSVLEGSGSGAFDSWPAEMLDTIWSSPAIADLNNDNKLDIIFGADISANPAAGTTDGGVLRAMSHDSVNGPTHLPGFDDQFGTLCDPPGSCPTDIAHYGKYVDQSLYSSPAIGDLDNDQDYEIVIGSGRPFSAGTLGHWVKVYDHQGNLLATLATDGVVFGSPALADLNNDTFLDIVVGTEILNDSGALAGRGTVYAWSGRDFSQLWRTDPAIIIGRQDIMPVTSSPIVADIDPNYSGPEILFGLGPEICVLSAAGEQLTADSTSSTKPTLWMGLSPVSNSPAVADIDNDGTLEIVAAGSYHPLGGQPDYRGWVVAWRWPGATGNAANAYLPWPMFRGDARHSGTSPVRPPTNVALAQLQVAQDTPLQTTVILLALALAGFVVVIIRRR